MAVLPFYGRIQKQQVPTLLEDKAGTAGGWE